MVSCGSFFHEFKALDLVEPRPARGAFVTESISIRRNNVVDDAPALRSCVVFVRQRDGDQFDLGRFAVAEIYAKAFTLVGGVELLGRQRHAVSKSRLKERV